MDNSARDDAAIGSAISRRAWLKSFAYAGGFVIACRTLPVATAFAAQDNRPETFNAFVQVGSDNTVTVVIKHLDKGQGVTTGLTTIVAEEMDAAWAQMRWQFAPADASLYNNLAWGGSQGTGGSSSVRNSWPQLREAGALARAMFVAAAAARWQVAPNTVTVSDGIVRAGKKHAATFGELAGDACEIEIAQSPSLKPISDFKLIGADIPRIDSAEKSSGRAIYTIDMNLPNMLHAAVTHPPRFGAVLSSVDDSDAKAVTGVRDVVTIDNAIAVVADSYWAALKGQRALKPKWQDDTGEGRSSAEISAALRSAAEKPGAIAASRGDSEAAFAAASRVIESEFEFPYLAHAAIEPLNAVVQIGDGRCEIWTGCQSPTRDQRRAAEILGIGSDKVTINTLYAGGSFGRRAVPDSDYVAQAVEIAKALGTYNPVKVQWTRENDMSGGRYRPVSLHRMRAALDDDGKLIAWQHRIAGQSFLVGSAFASMIKNGVDRTLVEGARGLPYRIPHFLCDTHLVEVGVPTLWWRSVGHTHNAYATEVFFDEVARGAGRDPIELRRELLQAHPRHLGVLDLALAQAGSAPSEPNRGRGVAVHESFRSFVAEVVDVTVEADGRFLVDKVTAAVDCGIAVNPDVIRAQIEGGIGYGLSAALREAVTLTDGVVNERNFDRYRPLRINEMPNVSVHIVPSQLAPTGVGEPGTPPIAPAVANALAAVTGRAIHRLPIGEKV